MKFKKAVIAICTIAIVMAGVAMLASVANAESAITVKWILTPEQQSQINILRIYDKDNVVVVDNIAPATTEVTFNTPDELNSWQIVTVIDTGENEIESGRSNSLPWSPAVPIAPIPGKFELSGSVILTPVQ